MENQPKLKNTKEVIALLAEVFPHCFCAEGEAKPLKIGIFQDLVGRFLNEAEVSKTQLRNALRHYTSSWRYLHGMKAGATRVDLDGNACGELEEQHVSFAREQLEAAKLRVQARRLAREQERLQAKAEQKERPDHSPQQPKKRALKKDPQQTAPQQKRQQKPLTRVAEADNAADVSVADADSAAITCSQTEQHARQEAPSASRVTKAGRKMSAEDNALKANSTASRHAAKKPSEKPAGSAQKGSAQKITKKAVDPLAAPATGHLSAADIAALVVGQTVNVKVGSSAISATVQEVAKEGVRVLLASGMSMIVRAEHLMC